MSSVGGAVERCRGRRSRVSCGCETVFALGNKAPKPTEPLRRAGGHRRIYASPAGQHRAELALPFLCHAKRPLHPSPHDPTRCCRVSSGAVNATECQSSSFPKATSPGTTPERPRRPAYRDSRSRPPACFLLRSREMLGEARRISAVTLSIAERAAASCTVWGRTNACAHPRHWTDKYSFCIASAEGAA